MSVVNRIRRHKIHRTRLTADCVNRVVIARGAYNNQQQAAMCYFDRNLKGAGLQGNCEEVFLFLGDNLTTVTIKYIYVTNSAATNVNFTNSDVTNNGVVRDSANSTKFWSSSYNPATDSTGKEATLGIWWYTGQTEATGSSRVMFGSENSANNLRPALLGWLNAGAWELGWIAADAAVSSQGTALGSASTGLIGAHNPNTRNTQLVINGVDSGSPGATTSTAFTSASVALYMFARNKGGTADLFARRDGRFAAITDGINSRASEWYQLVQSYQTFLNRAV